MSTREPVKLLVIYNPQAGHGRAARLLPRMEDLFRAQGLVPDVRLTEQPGHGTALVRDADLAGYDGVVAAGGDGTLFEVVNGFYARPQRPGVPLGVLPLGTGNAFARELDLVDEPWAEAVSIIGGGRTRRIDVGRFTTAGEQVYHFVNIVGLGFAAEATRSARSLKLFGNTAYTLAVLRQVATMKTYRVALRLDGQRVEHESLFIEISNSRYTGTTFLMAPDAELDDGLLDVTVVAPLARRRLLRLFPSIYDGSHVHYPEVTTYRARHVVIEAATPMALSPDGELVGQTPVEIECLPRDLAMFWKD